MSGKTQDWEHRYVAPRSKSLESSLQPRPDQDSVEVYPKSSSTQAQLLNQAVLALVCIMVDLNRRDFLSAVLAAGPTVSAPSRPAKETKQPAGPATPPAHAKPK